jgi:hypothetical protein
MEENYVECNAQETQKEEDGDEPVRGGPQLVYSS